MMLNSSSNAYVYGKTASECEMSIGAPGRIRSDAANLCHRDQNDDMSDRSANIQTTNDVYDVPDDLQSKPAYAPIASEEEAWDAIPNLDIFLTNLYTYWYQRGFSTIIVNNVTQMLSLGFTIIFSWVVINRLNVVGLLTCEAGECKDVPLLVHQSKSILGRYYNTPQAVITKLLYLPVFTSIIIYNFTVAYNNCLEAWNTRLYYRRRLNIQSDDVLSALQWPSVVGLLIEAQQRNPFCIVQTHLSVKDITNIIMRVDNYIIAMCNQQLFSSSLPSYIHRSYLHTRCPLLSIRFCIFYWMFDQRSRIRNDFITSPNKLQWRFRMAGLINLLLMGPVVLFVILIFFFKHSDEFRADTTSAFKRDFNTFSNWSSRNLNELPHQLDSRRTAARRYGDSLAASCWPNPAVASLTRFAKYIIGSILAILLLIGVLDDGPLLYVQVWGKNLLWYAIMLGGLLAFLRATEEHQEDLSSTTFPSLYMKVMRVVQYTEFGFTNLCGFSPVNSVAALRSFREEFKNYYYKPRYVNLIDEIIGVLITPLVLLFYLPDGAEDICKFVGNASVTLPYGDICCFGTLNVKLYGFALYGGDGSYERHLVTYDPKVFALQPFCRYRLLGGKLEKSLITFIFHYNITPWRSVSSALVIPPCVVHQRISRRCDQYYRYSDTRHSNPFYLYENSLPLSGENEVEHHYLEGIDTEILLTLEKFQYEELNLSPLLKMMLPRDLTVPLRQFNNTTTYKDGVCEKSNLSESEVHAAYIYWIERLYERKCGFNAFI